MSLSRFVAVYNTLPLATRNTVCCIIDGEGISWKLAYDEIKNNTDLGNKIQAKLISEGFI